MDVMFKYFVVSFGGGVVCVNLSVEFVGFGFEGYFYGLFYVDVG